MTQKYENIADDTVISFDGEQDIPIISHGMLSPPDFYKLATGHWEIYRWMESAFECKILRPGENWKTGQVTLATLFYPQGTELTGNDLVIAKQDRGDEDTEDEFDSLSFFSPFSLIRIAENDRSAMDDWLKQGFDCRVLMPGQDWQYGQVKISLVFYPDKIDHNPTDNPEFSLDDIRRTMSNVN